MEYAIGIDLGGTSIKYALVDKAGNSFFEGKLPSFRDDLYQWLCNTKSALKSFEDKQQK